MFNLISQSQEAVKTSLKVSLMAVMVSLAACGGGGSDGFYGGGTNSGGGTGGGTTTPTVVKISNIELYDVNNVLTRTVTVAGATAKVKVTDTNGKGIASALVTFTGQGVTFGTTNGAVLTNADGEASISVKPTNSNETGSYQLTASVSYNSLNATTDPYSFSLQAANIVLANMAATTQSLASGASTNITLKTQDATTGANQNNVSVGFSTSCGTFEPATVVSSNQGDVTTTYKSIDAAGKLCEGVQTITATGSNVSATKSLEVNIDSIVANSLVYTTSGAVNVVTKNSGSASSGQLEFTVFSNGVPAANQDVSINLVRGPDDISFVTEGNRDPKTVTSDASGKVVVNLYPGTIPGPVEIKATLLANTAVFVLSKNVAVATGRVYQKGLSLSMSKNSLATDVDGDTASIIARMADRVGNPVPDGTVISFVSEGGVVTPNCATVGGACSVVISTQNPRPVDGRVTVLAYVEGDKDYNDSNEDNLFTQGVDTLLDNIGDFFRDDNENNQLDTGEYVYRRGASGVACAPSSFPQPNIAGTCDGGLDAVLRDQMLFAFAHEVPTFVGVSGIDASMSTISSSSFTFQIYGNSQRTVPMPSATTVAVSAKDNTENSISCEANLVSGVTPMDNVMGLLSPAAFPLTSNDLVKYGVKLLKCASGDEVRINVTTPRNKSTTLIITL